MNIFLVNYILMLIEAMFLLYEPKKNPLIAEKELQKKKKIFVILQCIQWILISGLRAESVGADTVAYVWLFDMHKDMSWQDVFEQFRGYYSGEASAVSIEPGFLLVEKVVATIWDNQVFYRFVIASIFMSALGRFVYKNSDDPFLAFMLYAGLFYNMFSLTGYRQVLSVAVGILWAYEYIKQRKFFKFILVVLLASTFHRSTLIFIPFYFISQKKITAMYAVTVITGIIGMILFRNQLFELVKGFVGYDEYGVYAGFTQRNFLLLFGALSLLSIWRYAPVSKKFGDTHTYYNGLIMTAAMLPFAMVNPTSMRLVYDFAFMLMILVPRVVDSFVDKKEKTIVYTVSILIFGYFIATKSVPYEFFW